MDDVLVEYARFLHLAHVLPHGAVPSRTVDAVWHLHLIHTESYWNDLCGTILGRPLHHRPGTGRPGEASAFADRYSLTLADYAREFGAEPPEAVWPSPSPAPKPRLPRSLPASLLSTVLGTAPAEEGFV